MRLNRTALLPYYFLLLFLLLIVLSLLSSLNEQKSPDSSQNNYLEKELNHRLIAIQQQLNNFELMNKRRKSEIFYLQKLVQNVSLKTNQSNLLDDFNEILNQKVTNLSTNLNFLNNVNTLHSNYLDLPTIKQFLPYLDHNLSSLDPAYIHPTKRIRQDVEIVFGIPTVKRPKESYLILTLKNLIDNLDENGRNNSLFVVMIAETDMDYVHAISSQLDERFKQYIDDGLIEIIAVPLNYYPNFDLNNDIKDSMGDPTDRVRWRTKQNLDYAYLMMYCKNKGFHYMQLEDDIISTPNYYEKIKHFVYTQQIRKPDWLVIEFSNLGFIGKLFKTESLSTFISFFLMFYRDKPVDWLLENVSKVKYCRNDATAKVCKLAVSRHVLTSRPPLFQHLGVYSSMKGKIQKLKEKSFNSKENLYFAHAENPQYSKLSTDLVVYKTFDLESAYNGADYFWALSAKKGNYIQFEFANPIIVDQYRIRTGNWNHPLDIIYNATLSFRPVFKLLTDLEKKYKRDENGNYIVDRFLINVGKVEGSLTQFGAITLLRIDFHSNLENWVLISEIMIKPKLNR